MTTAIRETSINRYIRVLIKSVFVFSIISGIIIFISCILLKKYMTAAISALLVIFLYTLIKNNRVVRIILVKDDSVVVNDGNREIELRKEFISHVSKFVRFTLTQSFLLCIVLRGGNIFTVKRYLFSDDQRNNLIELLKNMQIELRNIP